MATERHTAINITDVHVFLLLVQNPEKSQHFYGDLLGLSKLFQDRDRVIYKVGRTRLMLHPEHGEFTEPREHGWGVAIYLEVDDVDSAIQELRLNKVRVIEEPTDRPWGERDAAVADPDGYHIYLSQSSEKSWKYTIEGAVMDEKHRAKSKPIKPTPTPKPKGTTSPGVGTPAPKGGSDTTSKGAGMVGPKGKY